MEKTFSLSEFKDLPIEERIELVENLWDNIAEVPETIERTEEQKRLPKHHKLIFLLKKDLSERPEQEKLR